VVRWLLLLEAGRRMAACSFEHFAGADVADE